eukprot:6206998-Pleurochrysis_carterae.AAC.2
MSGSRVQCAPLSSNKRLAGLFLCRSVRQLSADHAKKADVSENHDGPLHARNKTGEKQVPDAMLLSHTPRKTKTMIEAGNAPGAVNSDADGPERPTSSACTRRVRSISTALDYMLSLCAFRLGASDMMVRCFSACLSRCVGDEYSFLRLVVQACLVSRVHACRATVCAADDNRVHADAHACERGF